MDELDERAVVKRTCLHLTCDSARLPPSPPSPPSPSCSLSLPAGARVRFITFWRQQCTPPSLASLPPPSLFLPAVAGVRFKTFRREARYIHHGSSLLD